MKDLTYEIELIDYEKIVSYAMELDYGVSIITGNLLDSALIMDNEHIRVGRANPRKYIIIKSVYLNEWSSKLVMTMTNDKEKADEFYADWQMYEDEIEEEYFI